MHGIIFIVFTGPSNTPHLASSFRKFILCLEIIHSRGAVFILPNTAPMLTHRAHLLNSAPFRSEASFSSVSFTSVSRLSSHTSLCISSLNSLLCLFLHPSQQRPQQACCTTSLRVCPSHSSCTTSCSCSSAAILLQRRLQQRALVEDLEEEAL